MTLPGQIITFTANVYLILKGQSATLSWVCNTGNAVTLNGGSVGSSGSSVVYPTVTTTYTLKAITEGGSHSESITIVVGDAPPPVIPPSTTKYDLTITTNPVSCSVVIDNMSSYTSSSSGYLKIYGLSSGNHTVTVSKTGYTTKTETYSLASNLTITITLSIAPVTPPPSGPGGTVGAGGTSEPDFWTDPMGWVLWAIVSTVEMMLGFISRDLATLLLNINSFMNNYMPGLVYFIQDPVRSLQTWLNGVYITIQSLSSQITSSITSWWTSTSKSVVNWINDAGSSIQTWVNDQIGILQRGWDNVTSGIETWVNDQIGILQRGWDKVVGDIGAWFDDQVEILQRGWDATFAQIPGMISNAMASLQTWVNALIAGVTIAIDNVNTAITKWVNDQIGILQRGWDSTFGEIPGLIDGAVLGVKDFIFDTVPGIVEGVIMELIKSIPGLQTVIDFIGSLYDMITGKYPESSELAAAKQKNKETMDTVRNLLGK